MIVFGGAGRIQYTQIFQRTPDIADKETGNRPECGIQKTGLMPMCQIERHTRPVAGQQVCGKDNTFIKGRDGKERFHSLFSFDNVMVAVEQIQPVFLVELPEKPEDITMNIENVFHTSVFPQFVPVAQFDIGKTLPVIVFQCSEIQVLVLKKVVGGITNASVTVTHQNIAGTV